MRRVAASTCSSWRAGCSWGLPCKHIQPEILQNSLHTSNVPAAATRARARPAPRPASIAVQGAPNQLTHRTDESSLQPHQQQWTPVIDKPSGLTYFWNEQTGETTALGEPTPGPEGRRPVRMQSPFLQPPAGVRSTGAQLIGLVGAGAGIGLIFSLFARIF